MAEHTGIPEPSWYPRGYMMAENRFIFPILFQKIHPCSIANICSSWVVIYLKKTKPNLYADSSNIFPQRCFLLVGSLPSLLLPQMSSSVKTEDLNQFRLVVLMGFRTVRYFHCFSKIQLMVESRMLRCWEIFVTVIERRTKKICSRSAYGARKKSKE